MARGQAAAARPSVIPRISRAVPGVNDRVPGRPARPDGPGPSGDLFVPNYRRGRVRGRMAQRSASADACPGWSPRVRLLYLAAVQNVSTSIEACVDAVSSGTKRVVRRGGPGPRPPPSVPSPREIYQRPTPPGHDRRHNGHAEHKLVEMGPATPPFADPECGPDHRAESNRDRSASASRDHSVDQALPKPSVPRSGWLLMVVHDQTEVLPDDRYEREHAESSDHEEEQVTAR